MIGWHRGCCSSGVEDERERQSALFSLVGFPQVLGVLQPARVAQRLRAGRTPSPLGRVGLATVEAAEIARLGLGLDATRSLLSLGRALLAVRVALALVALFVALVLDHHRCVVVGLVVDLLGLSLLEQNRGRRAGLALLSRRWLDGGVEGVEEAEQLLEQREQRRRR